MSRLACVYTPYKSILSTVVRLTVCNWIESVDYSQISIPIFETPKLTRNLTWGHFFISYTSRGMHMKSHNYFVEISKSPNQMNTQQNPILLFSICVLVLAFCWCAYLLCKTTEMSMKEGEGGDKQRRYLCETYEMQWHTRVSDIFALPFFFWRWCFCISFISFGSVAFCFLIIISIWRDVWWGMMVISTRGRWKCVFIWISC